jgi:hypothetical protein
MRILQDLMDAHSDKVHQTLQVISWEHSVGRFLSKFRFLTLQTTSNLHSVFKKQSFEVSLGFRYVLGSVKLVLRARGLPQRVTNTVSLPILGRLPNWVLKLKF